MSTRIEKGPFGLHKIDFYRGVAEAMRVERTHAMFEENGDFVKVNNADYVRLADCYFNGTEEEWEQAEQWLRDMVAFRSEE